MGSHAAHGLASAVVNHPLPHQEDQEDIRHPQKDNKEGKDHAQEEADFAPRPESENYHHDKI